MVRETTSTREALLDAAYDYIVGGEWPRVRMADVAAVAGVSRQTLYNEFGSKDSLVQTLGMREGGRFLAGSLQAMEEHDGTPAEAVGAAVRWGLRTAGGNPLVRAVLTDDAGDLLPFVTTRAQPLYESFRDGIAAFLAQHWPRLGCGEARAVADVVVRLTLSYLLLPTAPVDECAGRVAHVVDCLVAGRLVA